MENRNFQLLLCLFILGASILPGDRIQNEVSSRIQKTRLAFATLRHLWRQRDTRLSINGRVYTATVGSVLLCGAKTWPLRAEDM